MACKIVCNSQEVVMAFFDFILNLFKSNQRQGRDNFTSPPLLVPGRPTKAAGLGLYGEKSALGRLSLRGRRYTPLATLRRIRDYNPDAALAVWNFLRLVNSGLQLTVQDMAGNPDEEGLELLSELSKRVGTEYGGGLNMLINVMVLTQITQGAIASEVELSDNLKDIVDYVLVDPFLIDFARNEQGKWAPIVAGLGKNQWINTNQFKYLPLDPDVDIPHGRSPFWPALRTSTFQIEVLDDLKAVAHNQGYPRIDVTVLRDTLLAHAPATLKAKDKEKELADWLQTELGKIQDAYNALNPDDTFIHLEGIEVGYVGPGRAGSINLNTLIRALDNQVVSSLKQLPILLGRNEASTTTHASIQWQIFIAGVEALQGSVKQMLEWLFNLSLQIYGRQSVATVAFTPIRKTDREAEARAGYTEARTWALKVMAGWASDNEAAQALLGHDAVGANMLFFAGELAKPEPAVARRQISQVDPSQGSELALINQAPAWMRAGLKRMTGAYQVLDQTWALRAQQSINALDRGNGQRGE